MAAFSVTCQSTGACTFQSTSTAAIGIASEAWDFGDGASAEGAIALHSFGGSGTFLVTLTVTDLAFQVASETKLLQLGAGGDSPLAIDDVLAAVAGADTPIEIAALLLNDAPGVAFLRMDTAPLHGSLTFGGSSQYLYRGNAGFSGTDSFQYSVRSENGSIGSAIVFLEVEPPPLVARLDRFTVKRTESVKITVPQLLANDEPPSAVFVGVENVVNGILADNGINAQGVREFEFTPSRAALSGSFDYQISRDGGEPYELGIVLIDVINKEPTVQFIVTCQNRSCLLHDYSFDDIAIVDYLVDWGDGTTFHAAAGSIPDLVHVYPRSDYFLVTLTLTDGEAATNSNSQWVLPNTPPVALPDSATTEREIPVTIPVLANDSDADGDSLAISVLSQSHNAAVVSLLPGGLRVTPPDGFVGTLLISYSVHDGFTSSAATTVTVTVNQWSSVTDVLGEQFYCPYNGVVRIALAQLLANDYDQQGDPLTITSMDTTVLSGILDCATEPGVACWYRAPVNSSGMSFFRYTASDPSGHRDTATVRIYVGGQRGHSPTVQDDYLNTTRPAPRVFTINDVLANDYDADGDTLTVSFGASGPRDFGALNCTSPMYQCTYTPNAGFVGTDRFPYTATDVMNPALTAYLNLLTLPPATATFDAREDIWSTGLNQQTSIPLGFLLANDFDPESDPLTVSSVDKAGLTGTMTCDSWGCTYKPPQSWSGITRFKYTATDGHGSSDTAIVKLRVARPNTAPIAAPDTRTTPKNTPLRFSVFELLKNDRDPDNDPLSVSLTTFGLTKGALACGSPQYWCTYTPNANVTGNETIGYTIGDGTAYATSTLTLTIQP